jgi:hypothetical protein
VRAETPFGLRRTSSKYPTQRGKCQKHMFVRTPCHGASHTLDAPVGVRRDLAGNSFVNIGRVNSEQGHFKYTSQLLVGNAHKEHLLSQKVHKEAVRKGPNLDYAVRFFAGGLIVSAFAILGDVLRPKSFAGLFGAAPSVALATLTLAILKNSPAYVATEGPGPAILR